jgi:hypothetical protein
MEANSQTAEKSISLIIITPNLQMRRLLREFALYPSDSTGHSDDSPVRLVADEIPEGSDYGIFVISDLGVFILRDNNISFYPLSRVRKIIMDARPLQTEIESLLQSLAEREKTDTIQ